MLETILVAFTIAFIISSMIFLLMALAATIGDTSFNEIITGRVVVNFFKCIPRMFNLKIAMMMFTLLSLIFVFPVRDTKKILNLEKNQKCTCSCKQCQKLNEADVADRLAAIERKLDAFETDRYKQNHNIK